MNENLGSPKTGKKNNTLILAVCFMIVFAAGFFGSLFTSKTVNSSWYLENKPGITPPNWVFAPVWTVLYFLIAISLYIAWTKAKAIEKKKVALIFGINLFANALWSYFFFGLQNAGIAFADLIIMIATIVFMIFMAGRIDRKAGWLLVPYLAWVSFAGILNLGFLL